MTAGSHARRPAAPTARARGWAARRPWLLLLPLLAAFIAVPLLGPSINPNLYGDEAGYLRLADNLAHGSFLTGRDDLVSGDHYPNLWFGPGFPLLLTPFVALDLPASVVRLVGPLLLFLAMIVFLHLLGRDVPKRAAIAGAAAFGLYLPFYTVLEHLHSETLALLLVVLAMYGTRGYLRDEGARYLLLAGGALGGLALTRVAFGWILTALLVVALLWWALRRDGTARRCAAVCAVALAVCVPWLAYTYSVTERPLYWGSSGGLSLYWMSSPYPGEQGDWQQAREVFTDPELAPHRPFFRSLAGKPLVEQDEELVRAALEHIRESPVEYARNVLANVSRTWFDLPYSFRAERLAPLLFIVSNGILLTAVLACLALLVRVRPVLPPEAVPFGLFAIAALAFHALLAAYPRMLFPVVPVAIWLVVLVVTRVVRLEHGRAHGGATGGP